MKPFFYIVSLMAFCLFSSFKMTEACEYAGSNLGYVKTQTEKAIDAEDLDIARYHTFKALDAIYKSQNQLKDCGCDQAAINIEESHHILKKATESTSVMGAKILLSDALYNTLASLKALEKHHLHENTDIATLTATDTFENNAVEINLGKENNTALHRIIDKSLLKYEASLAKVIDSVSCKSAKLYANQVFENCEKQLLKGNLSEAKKYYNLRTQEITADALKRMNTCSK